MDTNTAIILAIAVVVVGVAILSVVFVKREKTRKLKTKFGPEYDRLAGETDSTRRAEAELGQREKRVATYQIRPLTPEECERFSTAWHSVQERFVDSPQSALADADLLVNQAMRARGYPMSDFDQQAADLSVDHPRVVEDYRFAHDIAVRDKRGQANTEDLRRAMQHYRSLFEDLLSQPVMAYGGTNRYGK